MRIGNGSSFGRRAWLFGRLAVLMAIVVTGTLAIVRYSSPGATVAGRPGPPAVTARASTAATAATTGRAGSAPSASRHAGAPRGRPGNAGARRGAPAGASAGSATSAAPESTSHAGSSAAPVHFRTLPPGAALPTGAECASWVDQSPAAENKAANRTANHTTGQHVGPHFFAAGDSPQADRLLAARIDGGFTGTTRDILRWAACKWGIDQNVVFAQAAVESWWQQDTLGDWGTDASACPPGHQSGADGKPGQCPQSYGILQNRYPYEQGSWPGIGGSTAMNADTAYAIWRSCYDGYEVWLNNVPHGQAYRQGDLWGCVGRWFAGRWHTAAAQQYIARVQAYQRERIWLTRDFQQG